MEQIDTGNALIQGKKPAPRHLSLTRHRRFADERKPACAGALFPGIPIRIQPEHANGHDQKTPARQHRHGRETAFPPPCATAQTEGG
jgi:hypothetical protein